MPNWCGNTLIVRGQKPEIARFVRENKAGDLNLSFNAMVPMPVELERTQSPNNAPEEQKQALRAAFGSDNWYDWHIAAWGTKWDIGSAERTIKGPRVTYSFETAWGPPTEWLDRIRHFYPQLSFELSYEEPGMGFAGCITASVDGFTDETWDYVED